MAHVIELRFLLVKKELVSIKNAHALHHESGSLKGIVTLFGNFMKSQKVSSHQLNFKTNDLDLLCKTV